MVWDDKTPKYKQLKEEIKEWLRTGHILPYHKIPSEHQLIQKFKVSRHTVRQALAELTQEGWLYKEQGKGTFANPPREGMQKQIAVITTYISDYIFPYIIRGVEEYLRKYGYSLLLYSTDNNLEKEKDCLEAILRIKPAGVIVEPTKSALPNPNLYLYEELKHQKIPLMMINSYYEELEQVALLMDDEAVGYQAVKHLFDLGHSRILGLFKGDDLQGLKRKAGFMKAFKEAGITLSSSDIGQFMTENREFLPGRWVSNKINLDHQKPTAIVCYNDQISMQVLQALREKMLEVPKDISLLGCDDSPLAVTSEVKLSTFSHPKQAMGRLAAKLIIDQIDKAQAMLSKEEYQLLLDSEGISGVDFLQVEKEAEIVKIMYQPNLIIRSSTKAL